MICDKIFGNKRPIGLFLYALHTLYVEPDYTTQTKVCFFARVDKRRHPRRRHEVCANVTSAYACAHDTHARCAGKHSRFHHDGTEVSFFLLINN